jgi:hypothetical protein
VRRREPGRFEAAKAREAVAGQPQVHESAVKDMTESADQPIMLGASAPHA